MLPSLHLLIRVRLDVWRDAATSYANRKKLAIYRTTHVPLLRPPASAEHLDKSPGLKHAASVTPYVKSLLEDEEDVDD